MSALQSLGYDNSIEEPKDTLGSGFSVRESGVYLMTIAMAYLAEADSGALGVNFIFKDENDTEYRETVYVTSGKAKGKKNYYEKEGKKHYLPGFLTADAIALLSSGKSISELDTEKKLVKVWNKEAQTEVPTEVDCLTGLLGKQIQLGILKNSEFKTQKTDNGYVDTDEIRETNTIDRVFHAKHGKTVAECKAKKEDAEFLKEWKTAWEGKVKDKTKGKTPTVKAGSPAARTTTPTESLFA